MCGTNDNDDLTAGAFNEADSHKSFLEALNEWRNANKAGNVQPSSTDAGRSSAPHQPGMLCAVCQWTTQCACVHLARIPCCYLGVYERRCKHGGADRDSKQVGAATVCKQEVIL